MRHAALARVVLNAIANSNDRMISAACAGLPRGIAKAIAVGNGRMSKTRHAARPRVFPNAIANSDVWMSSRQHRAAVRTPLRVAITRRKTAPTRHPACRAERHCERQWPKERARSGAGAHCDCNAATDSVARDARLHFSMKTVERNADKRPSFRRSSTKPFTPRTCCRSQSRPTLLTELS